MSQNIRVQMKQWNGTDFDEVYPNASNGVMAQIIVTPNVKFTSIQVTTPSGKVLEGALSNEKLIFEVNEYGEYSIEGEGSEPDNKSLIIDTCKQYKVTLGKIPLNDYTWQQIREASDNGTASSLWAVGDAKQITINGTIGAETYSNYQPWVYILGFNHNSQYEGNNRIHFGCFRRSQNYAASNSICLDEVNATDYFSMNSSATNSGGWKSCQMRTALLDADASSPSSAASNSFLKALPDDLKAVLKQCTKYTDNTGGGNDTASYVTSTNDWVWLLSEFEVQGSRKYANSAEQNYQAQYQYYKDGNSKVKYQQSGAGSSVYWWFRSPHATKSSYFCGMLSTGSSVSYAYAQFSRGVAPSFCV